MYYCLIWDDGWVECSDGEVMLNGFYSDVVLGQGFICVIMIDGKIVCWGLLDFVN